MLQDVDCMSFRQNERQTLKVGTAEVAESLRTGLDQGETVDCMAVDRVMVLGTVLHVELRSGMAEDYMVADCKTALVAFPSRTDPESA